MLLLLVTMAVLVLLIALTILCFLAAAAAAGDGRGRQRVGFQGDLTGVDWMVVDTGRRVEVESPACEREGENRLTAPAQDRLCSGVSRSLAVSAADLGVMGGHHRQQRRSIALPLRGGASLEGEGLFLRLRLLLQTSSVLLDVPSLCLSSLSALRTILRPAGLWVISGGFCVECVAAGCGRLEVDYSQISRVVLRGAHIASAGYSKDCSIANLKTTVERRKKKPPRCS